MCRLFALKTDKPTDVAFTLVSSKLNTQQLGATSPQGWGFGWYEDGIPKRMREPIKAVFSKKYEKNTRPKKSDVFFGHIRYATNGRIAEWNCQPFKIGNWMFVHNGSIDRNRVLYMLNDAHYDALEGETDSEAYFHFIMQCIEEETSVEEGIIKAIKRIRPCLCTSLNFILSEGKTLYAYREGYGLYFLKQNPNSPEPIAWPSEETAAVLQSKSLKKEKAVVVCSEILSDEDWKSIPLRHLLRVSDDLETECIALN